MKNSQKEQDRTGGRTDRRYMTGQEEEQTEGTGQHSKKNSQKEQDITGGRTARRNRTEQEEEQTEGT